MPGRQSGKEMVDYNGTDSKGGSGRKGEKQAVEQRERKTGVKRYQPDIEGVL